MSTEQGAGQGKWEGVQAPLPSPCSASMSFSPERGGSPCRSVVP